MKLMGRMALCALALMPAGCASSGGGIDLSHLPPVVIGVPSSAPTPQPDPAPLPTPKATLAFVVLDVDSGGPIPTAIATFEDGTGYQANDDGYIAIETALQTYRVTISADDYAPSVRTVMLTANRQFEVRLKSTKPTAQPAEPSAPPIVTPPAPVASVFAECSASNNTLRISRECVDAVARTSMFWRGCEAGSQHDCHYYVREIALALAKAQTDPRWGIVRKTSGENVDGYAEDVVAYLPAPLPLDAPTWQWRGVDLVGGSGAPGARAQWGELHPAIKCTDPPSAAQLAANWCNREDMTWAPVPR